MNKYEELMDRLADKSLTFGCEVLSGERSLIVVQKYEDGYFTWLNKKFLGIGTTFCNPDKILGHPVLIGDVLEKIDQLEAYNTEYIENTVRLWRCCGFTKSLREIYEGTEVIEHYIYPDDGTDCVAGNNCCEGTPCEHCKNTIKTYKLKDQNAEGLFSYLFKIGL